MPRLTPAEAREIAAAYGIDLSVDFHSLDAESVAAVIAAADARRYRKPRGASGSRGRYFHALLHRTAHRKD